MEKDYISELPPALASISNRLPAIGLVAVNWTQVEIQTQRLMAQLLHLEGAFSVATTAHIGDRTAIELILSVARLYTLPTSALEAIEAFAAAHNICRGNRNLIIHGTHLNSEPGVGESRMCIQKVSARGRVKVLFLEVTLETIFNVAKECSALAGYCNEIVNLLQTYDGKTEPQKLLQLFPSPSDLMTILPPLSPNEILQPRSFESGWTTSVHGT